MNVEVQLFAAARDLAGTASVVVQTDESASVADLRRRLVESFPALEFMANVLLVAVNNEYADDDRTIGVGDRVACFPPVSGG